MNSSTTWRERETERERERERERESAGDVSRKKWSSRKERQREDVNE